MSIIYSYPKISSLNGKDSFVVTDASDNNRTKTVAWEDVLRSNNLVQNTKVTLTPEQILDLHNTPVELIPAPGVDKFLVVFSIYVYLDFNTTPYAASNSGIINFRYGDFNTVMSGGLAGVSQMLEKTKDTFQGGQLPTIRNEDAWLPNENIQAFCSSAITNGDSPINVYISYIIKDL